MSNSGIAYWCDLKIFYGYQLLASSIREAAKFAVEDHNKKTAAEDHLEFIGVEQAATRMDCGFLTYLTLVAKDVHGIEKLFTTAVCEMPWLNNAKGSVELEHVCEVSQAALPAPPPPSCFYPTSLLDRAPEAIAQAEFAVKRHNARKHTQLELVDVVEWIPVGHIRQFTKYLHTLVVRDQRKLLVVETKVTQGEFKKESFMELSSFTIVSEVPYRMLIQMECQAPGPPMISHKMKATAEFAVNSHNRMKNTQLEFVDCMRITSCDTCANDSCVLNVTLQAVDQGTHKIFKTKVTEENLGKFTKSDELEYFDEAQPRPKAQSIWISPELFSKADKLQLRLREIAEK